MEQRSDGIVFCMLCPRISTGREKLAPAGWHGWHVFATLVKRLKKTQSQTFSTIHSAPHHFYSTGHPWDNFEGQKFEGSICNPIQLEMRSSDQCLKKKAIIYGHLVVRQVQQSIWEKQSIKNTRCIWSLRAQKMESPPVGKRHVWPVF